MPRKNLIRTNLHPYHVTIRSNNREWFELPLREVWDICIEALKFANRQYPVKLQAFVLMSNHYHLMLWTPNCDLDKFMYVFNSKISKSIRKKTGRINRIFGDRYKWSVIEDVNYFRTCLRDIYQNPVKANIVLRCEEYVYSSVFYVIRDFDLDIDWFCPLLEDREEFIEWMNKTEENSVNIKKALQRPIFKIPNQRSSRRKG